MSLPVATEAISVLSIPRHDEIAQCARKLWTESGQPEGRDEAIWIEAEQRLISERRRRLEPAVVLQATASAPSNTQNHGQKKRRAMSNPKYVM